MSSPSQSVSLPVVRRRPPWILRVCDQIFNRLPFDLLGTSQKSIMSLAERTTSLSDWGDEAYLRRLQQQCDSVSTASELSFTGRFGYRTVLHWHAVNRLRQVEVVKRHPEVRDEPFEKPIFIVGGYRTGTTHLHTLLSQDPALRMPRAWELSFPIPKSKLLVRADRSRRRRAQLVFGLNQFIMPDQAEVHDVKLDGPEECHFLLENSALSMTQYIVFLGYQYAHWLLTQDNQSAYDDMRLQYQILAYLDRKQGRATPGQPWILKCPLHTWYLKELMKAFPDGRFIWTHRPMEATLPSTCGLTAVTATKFFREVDGRKVGAVFQDYCVRGFQRALEQRDTLVNDPFIDVRLAELSKNPHEVLSDIYEQLDMPFSEPARAGVRQALAANQKQRSQSKKHGYTLEEFGLERSHVRELFSDYETRFGLR